MVALRNKRLSNVKEFGIIQKQIARKIKRLKATNMIRGDFI